MKGIRTVPAHGELFMSSLGGSYLCFFCKLQFLFLLFSLILRPCLLYRFWHFCVGNIFYYIICLLISVIFLLYRNILKHHCKFCYYFSLIASRFLHHVWEGLFHPVIIKYFLYFLYFYSFTFYRL